jgi:hypothetical protein
VGRLYSQCGFAKVRHTVAIALIGWYLMVPPVTRGPNGIYQAVLDGPLSQWRKHGPYETLAKCTQAQAALLKAAESKIRENDIESIESQFSAYTSQCVASNDPRFKAK